jgi:hypothetical protein
MPMIFISSPGQRRARRVPDRLSTAAAQAAPAVSQPPVQRARVLRLAESSISCYAVVHGSPD